MPSPEKARLQAHLNVPNATSAPPDLPPAYDNTLTPNLPTSTPRTPTSTSTSPPSPPVPSQNPLKALSRLSSLKLSGYSVRDATLSADLTTLTTSNAELVSKQYALAKFIHDQAALPPKPVMVVRGTHASHSAGSVVDFELKLNLTTMLDLDQPPEGAGRSRLRVKVFQPGSGQQEASSSSSSTTNEALFKRTSIAAADDTNNPLDAWIRKFTTDAPAKADNRSFTLRRVALNLPRGILEGHVRTLVAATKYRGKVTVEFALLHRDVTVERRGGNWFTNLLSITPTRKFDVVESVWAVGGGGSVTGSGGDHGAGFAGEGGSGGGGASENANAQADGAAEGDRNGRAGLVAQEWWREWQMAVWNSVLAGRKGWVTVEDWIEAGMGIRSAEKSRDWGVDYQ